MNEARAVIKEAVELVLENYRVNAKKDAPVIVMCDHVGILRP